MATLLIDADDTLWENIIIFHRINAAYAQWVAPERDAEAVRAELDEIQVGLVATHGYGRDTFQLSLLRGVEHFAARTPTPLDETTVASLVAPLRWDELDLIDGVAETLELLNTDNQLLMVTKGNHAEQSHKVERSGLRHFFDAVEILPDKTVDQYERIVTDHSLDPNSTWMIGNSPRSDIVPALDAGLHAIFIPHAQTWSHELAEVPDHPRLTQLTDFTKLRFLFT